MAEQQQATQPASQPITYYQTAVLTPDLVNTLVTDDSPNVLFDKFWAFFGVDIPVSVIYPWDFQNILDMVDINVYNYMQDYKEEDWEDVAIVEYQEMEVEENEQTVRKMVPVRAYKIIETWESMKAKIYMKMCRAREGFTLRQLTESKSTSTIEERLHSTTAQAPMNMQGGIQYPRKQSRWKVW